MTIPELIRVGTRGSALAEWQADFVITELTRLYPSLRIEKVIIKTTGDTILDTPLANIGDKGLFTKEIESALIEGKIDLAVHSMKDLPTSLPCGLSIGAVLKREDARDVFISHPHKPYKSIQDIPTCACIATGSLRRQSQLLHKMPGLNIVDLRGNLGTRRQKLADSNWDGIILAYAGVKRLGWENIITQILQTEFLLPAVGQGALAIEVRTEDKKIIDLLSPLKDIATYYCIMAERALLRALEGGCQIPIGAFAYLEGQKLILTACVGSLDGKKIVREKLVGDLVSAEQIGTKLAEKLIFAGAKDILASIRVPSHE